jgi:O-antigen ligase
MLEGNAKDAIHIRLILWNQAINMFLDHPVTGVGIGQYIFNLPDYNLSKYGDPNIKIDNPTNLFLEILSEMGIIQLIIFVWFLVEIMIYFSSTFRIISDKKVKTIFLNLFLSFIVMLFLYNLTGVTSSFAIRYLFFIIAGLIINLSLNFNKQKNKPNFQL